MFINERKCAIEMSKKEAKAAAKFGSEEYKNLQIARKDYPNFKVVTVTRKTTSCQDTYKGLTYAFMESYIQKHDDDSKTIMAEFLTLRGLSEAATENLLEPYSYNEMKTWFLKTFPAIEEFHKMCDARVAA